MLAPKLTTRLSIGRSQTILVVARLEWFCQTCGCLLEIIDGHWQSWGVSQKKGGEAKYAKWGLSQLMPIVDYGIMEMQSFIFYVSSDMISLHYHAPLTKRTTVWFSFISIASTVWKQSALQLATISI